MYNINKNKTNTIKNKKQIEKRLRTNSRVAPRDGIYDKKGVTVRESTH
jgi:hypothetical protein